MANYIADSVSVETRVRVSLQLEDKQTREILNHLNVTAAQAAIYAGFSVAGLTVTQCFDFSENGGQWLIDLEAYDKPAEVVTQTALDALQAIIKSM